MIVLGIESATELAGAAVADVGGVRASAWATGRRRHAEVLTPAIVHVVDQAGLSLPSLDAVAVDVGPGLFTGLRVGVATAKGLSQALDVGVLGVTSLEVLAHAAWDAGVGLPVCSVVDARRGELFAACYAPAQDPSAAPEVLEPPGRCRPEELAALLAARAGPDAPFLAVGDGAIAHRTLLAALPGVAVSGSSLAYPPPGAVAALGAARLHAGATLLSPDDVVPCYLREADARIGWAMRSRPPARELGGGSPASESSEEVAGRPVRSRGVR